MNRDQFNRNEMCNTVAVYMEKNKSIWGGVKAMNDTVDDVNTCRKRIAGKIRKQQEPITGAADEKAQVRLSFEEKILELADQLSALAEVKQDSALAAQVEWTLSSLDKLADDQLEATGKSISALTLANLTELADYDITQADVDELDQWTARFGAVKNAPRTAIAGRAGETHTMPDEQANLTSILRNRLDKQMTKFRKSNPEFYAGSRSARVIVDRGGSVNVQQPASPSSPKAA
jgi:hypothetical protein